MGIGLNDCSNSESSVCYICLHNSSKVLNMDVQVCEMYRSIYSKLHVFDVFFKFYTITYAEQEY